MLQFALTHSLTHLSGSFCLDELWVNPVGGWNHLRVRLDFFVLLTGQPKQNVLLTVLRLQELPKSYLSGWRKKKKKINKNEFVVCVCKVKDSHLCSWGVCPQIHSKSRHHPADPWESNTIYPWTEDHNQSLTKFLRELGGHGSRPNDSFVGLNVCFREIQTKIGVQLTAIEKLLDTFHMASDWQRSNQICSNSLYRHRLVSSVREVPGRLKMGSWFFGNEGSQVTGRI